MLKDHCAIRAHARLRRARLVLVFALVSGAALILAACGGGGGGGSPISLKTSEQPSYLLGAIGASSSGGVGANRGPGVAVAVIDGEFDTGHLDLAGAFRRDAGGKCKGTMCGKAIAMSALSNSVSAIHAPALPRSQASMKSDRRNSVGKRTFRKGFHTARMSPAS